GQLQAERRAPAGVRLDLQRAAQPVEVVLDHVHADAAPGQVGDLGRGREPGQEDQAEQLRLAHAGQVSGAVQALLGGLAADGGRVEAPATVAELDDDLTAG